MRHIIVFLIIIICMSCQKQQSDDDKYWGHVPLDNSIYTYLFQPEGSVLIFQDSLTGEIDTLTVFKSDLDTFNLTNDYGKLVFHGESWLQSERHSISGHSFTFSTSVRDPRYFTNCIVSKSGIRNGFGNDIFIFGPIPVFLGSSWQLDHNSINKIANYYDSISFDSTVYYKVYSIHTISEHSTNNTDNLYYYAKGYGLIRWEELTNQKIWKRVL